MQVEDLQKGKGLDAPELFGGRPFKGADTTGIDMKHALSAQKHRIAMWSLTKDNGLFSTGIPQEKTTRVIGLAQQSSCLS